MNAIEKFLLNTLISQAIEEEPALCAEIQKTIAEGLSEIQTEINSPAASQAAPAVDESPRAEAAEPVATGPIAAPAPVVGTNVKIH
jgi:hypothetical protein